MRDFGSKLADYEASDDPVMDLNSLESERTQFLRQNDDTEVVNEAEGDDDDAVRCIPKVMQVSFIVIEGVIYNILGCKKGAGVQKRAL